MKQRHLENSVMIVVRMNIKGKKKTIDFFLVDRQHNEYYAFSKPYSYSIYERCKKLSSVNSLVSYRCKNKGIMILVKYTRIMVPYLADYYDLPLLQKAG